MNIDTEHLHHWMQAVRKSPDPMRTMDAFWRGQLKSKEWLIGELERQKLPLWPSIEIHGGWVGVLASMIFQSEMYVKHITSIDIDPTCEEIANTMNQIELEAGRFRAVTSDMCDYQSKADIIINTSCEHISQGQYDLWLSQVPESSLLILQSNNYDIPEHIRTAPDLDTFKHQCHVEVLWSGELELPLYKRFMIIGRR